MQFLVRYGVLFVHDRLKASDILPLLIQSSPWFACAIMDKVSAETIYADTVQAVSSTKRNRNY